MDPRKLPTPEPPGGPGGCRKVYDRSEVTGVTTPAAGHRELIDGRYEWVHDNPHTCPESERA